MLPATARVAIAAFALALTEPPTDVAHRAGPFAVFTADRLAEGDDASGSRAIELALVSQSRESAALLTDGLDRLADRLDARAHPFGEDLAEGEVGDEMAESVRRISPALIAARALAAERLTLPDGTGVHFAASCPAGADEACFDLLRDPARTEQQRKALFAAWPLVASAVLRVEPDGLERARAALRASADSPESRIALVLGPSDLETRAAQAREALRPWALRVQKRLRLPLVDALAAPISDRGAAPHVTLAADELLVVPRLSALAESHAFAKEVEAALASASVRATPYASPP